MAVLSLLFSSLVTCSFLCSIFTLVQAEKYRKSSPRNWRFPTWLTRNWKNSPYFVARPYVSCGTTPYFEANNLFGDHSADKEPKWPWARDWKMMSQENGLSRVLSIFSSLFFFFRRKILCFLKGKICIKSSLNGTFIRPQNLSGPFIETTILKASCFYGNST